MTRSQEERHSFIYVVRLIHTRCLSSYMTHSHVPWRIRMSHDSFTRAMTHSQKHRDSFIHVMTVYSTSSSFSFIHDAFLTCAMTYSHVPWFLHTCHDSCTEAQRFIGTCHDSIQHAFHASYSTPSFIHHTWRLLDMCHDLLTCASSRDSFTRATTHSHRSRETHAYVFWSIHMRQGFTHTGPWRIHMRCVFIWDVDVSHMSNDSRDQHMSHMMLETNTCLIWHEQTLYRRIHVWYDMTRHFTHESGPVLINMFQINWGGHVWMSLSTSVIESWPMWNSHGTCDWLLC